MTTENKEIDYLTKKCGTCYWLEEIECVYKHSETTVESQACILYMEDDDFE